MKKYLIQFMCVDLPALEDGGVCGGANFGVHKQAFNSREEALNDAICSIEDVRSYLDTDDPTIYLGKCQYIPLRTDVDVERVLEYLDEAYCEDTGCENYIYDGVTDEQFKWLEGKFSEVMEEFHKMANINPGWFNVTEIEEIDLSEYVKQR